MEITVQVGEQERRYSKTRIYVSPVGETVMENIMNRRQRPHTFYRKEVLPKLFSQLGWSADTKVKWSQFAGCSCPCSPGFVVENTYGRNIWVNVA
jgi:hypothetical protein